MVLISEQFRKNMLARFSPRFVRSPNPGSAGDSNPEGGSVKARLGKYSRAWAICWCLAGGQLLKAGREGGYFVLTPPASWTLSFQC